MPDKTNREDQSPDTLPPPPGLARYWSGSSSSSNPDDQQQMMFHEEMSKSFSSKKIVSDGSIHVVSQQNDAKNNSLNIFDADGNLVYSIPRDGKQFGGANGVAHLDAVKHSGSDRTTVVIKEARVNASQDMSDLLVNYKRERDNWLDFGEKSELLYDPEHKKLYLVIPRRFGKDARHVIEEQVTEVEKHLESGNNVAALLALRDMLKVLKLVLQDVKKYQDKTHKFHGDAHLGNVMISDGQNEANIIDLGGSTRIGITAADYTKPVSEGGLTVGGGFYYTPPEIPCTACKPENAEHTAAITEKTDLHSFVADFWVRGIVDLPGALRGTPSGWVQTTADQFVSESIEDIVTDISRWALLNCANSNHFYDTVAQASTKFAKKMANERNNMPEFSEHNSSQSRIDMQTAISNVQGFIDRIEMAAKVAERINNPEYVSVKQRIKAIENKRKT